MSSKFAVIADDDDGVRSLLGLEVRRHGYTVVAAADGFQALASAETLTRVDLLITDHHMPGMDGLQLACSVRRVFPGVPVLLISGDETALAEAERMMGGPTRGLAKPFGIVRFHAAMRDIQALAAALPRR